MGSFPINSSTLGDIMQLTPIVFIIIFNVVVLKTSTCGMIMNSLHSEILNYVLNLRPFKLAFNLKVSVCF